MSKSELKREFSQEEARKIYTMLYTLVYALRDIINRGLTVTTITELSKELAIFFGSLTRVVGQAEKLLKELEIPEPPIVQEIEDRLLKPDQDEDTKE